MANSSVENKGPALMGSAPNDAVAVMNMRTLAIRVFTILQCSRRVNVSYASEE